MRILLASAVLLFGLAFYAMPAHAMVESCMAPPPPVINVTIVEDTMTFDLGKDSAHLEAFKTDADHGRIPSAYHSDSAFDVRGATIGNFRINQNVEYRYGDAIASDEVCVSIASINVTLTFSAAIYIASELAGHECWFSQILAHEAKHVAADRAITALYKDKIRDILEFAFNMPGDYSSGRIDSEDVMVTQLMLENAVEGATAAVFGSLMRERNTMQAEIDNLDEYIRIARACPEEGVERATPVPLPFVTSGP